MFGELPILGWFFCLLLRYAMIMMVKKNYIIGEYPDFV